MAICAAMFGGGVVGCYQLSAPARHNFDSQDKYDRARAKYDEGADQRLVWQVVFGTLLSAGLFGFLAASDLTHDPTPNRD